MGDCSLEAEHVPGGLSSCKACHDDVILAHRRAPKSSGRDAASFCHTEAISKNTSKYWTWIRTPHQLREGPCNMTDNHVDYNGLLGW